MNCKTSTFTLPVSKVEGKNPGKALVDSKVVPATGGTAACRAAADRKEEDTIGVRRIVAVVELDIHKSDTVLAQVGDTKHMRQLQDKLQLCKEKHKEEGHMTRSPAAATTCKVGRTEHNVREACVMNFGSA